MADTQITIPDGMECVAGRPDAMEDVALTFCPGCTHGTIMRLVAGALSDLGLKDRAVMIAPVGCAGRARRRGPRTRAR